MVRCKAYFQSRVFFLSSLLFSSISLKCCAPMCLFRSLFCLTLSVGSQFNLNPKNVLSFKMFWWWWACCYAPRFLVDVRSNGWLSISHAPRPLKPYQHESAMNTLNIAFICLVRAQSKQTGCHQLMTGKSMHKKWCRFGPMPIFFRSKFSFVLFYSGAVAGFVYFHLCICCNSLCVPHCVCVCVHAISVVWCIYANEFQTDFE